MSGAIKAREMQNPNSWLVGPLYIPTCIQCGRPRSWSPYFCSKECEEKAIQEYQKKELEWLNEWLKY